MLNDRQIPIVLNRHSSLFFLVREESQDSSLAKIGLRCIELPCFDGICEGKTPHEYLMDIRDAQCPELNVTKVRLHAIESDINLDMPHNDTFKVVKAIIGQTKDENKEGIKAYKYTKVFLTIQLTNQIVVK